MKCFPLPFLRQVLLEREKRLLQYWYGLWSSLGHWDITEALVVFKGTHTSKSYIPGKHHRFGSHI